MDYGEIVKKYIKLRDKKAALKAEYEKQVEKIDSVLDLVEAKLLDYFNENNLESISTSAGVAYTSTRTTCSVADWDTFWKFVYDGEMWHMLEHRAAKKAVEEYRLANNDLPPGLNWREEKVVNIRRG